MSVKGDFRARILVADAEAAAGGRTAEQLRRVGYEPVGVAETAAQAVDMARSRRPDLVLLEVALPGLSKRPGAAQEPAFGGMDGVDACRTIQHDLDIPAVFLTSCGEEAVLLRARMALPRAYLLKPCADLQLRAAIETVLALHASSGPAVEFALREANHRIENSFTLLHSMLRVAELGTADPAARHVLADAGARVLAMAAAHEAMGRCIPGGGANGREPVETLARALFAAQAPLRPLIRLTLDVDDVPLAPAQLVPCGIFVAEALTNALKHAFPGGRKGEIRVALHAGNGRGLLSVSDDGVGCAGNAAASGCASFGMQCLDAAARQLGGELRRDAENGRGARFGVSFPLFCLYRSQSA